MEKLLKRFFQWIFKSELSELKNQINRAEKNNIYFEKILKNIDVSVDVHETHYSKSWAVISLQGKKTDYLKFIDLGVSDITEIERFLRQFERNHNIKIDASPRASEFFRIKRS